MDWLIFKENLKKCLCPPGDGVFTLHTGKERKKRVQEKLYGDSSQVLNSWQKSLDSFPLSSAPVLLGIPSDCGGGILRGANWGPLFIREQLLWDKNPPPYFDLGDVRVIPHLLQDELLQEKTIQGCRQALYHDGNSSLPVSPLSIAQYAAQGLNEIFPFKRIFMLGGDHSVSYPIVHEYLLAKKKQNKKVAVIHFDSHIDILPSRQGIPITFTSWAYHILNDLFSPDLLVQIGINSTGRTQEYWESSLGVKQFWAKDLLGKQVQEVAVKIVEHLRKRHVEEIYISFDIDVMDASYVSATGTPEHGGLSPYEAFFLLEYLRENFVIGGADLVEVAPFISHGSSTKNNEPESTLKLSLSLSQFFLGALNNS